MMEILEVWEPNDAPAEVALEGNTCEAAITCDHAPIGYVAVSAPDEIEFVAFVVIAADDHIGQPLVMCTDCDDYLQEAYGQGVRVDG